jgi:hypothetical protein
VREQKRVSNEAERVQTAKDAEMKEFYAEHLRNPIKLTSEMSETWLSPINSDVVTGKRVQHFEEICVDNGNDIIIP